MVPALDLGSALDLALDLELVDQVVAMDRDQGMALDQALVDQDLAMDRDRGMALVPAMAEAPA